MKLVIFAPFKRLIWLRSRYQPMDCGKSQKWRLPSFMMMFNNSVVIQVFRMRGCRGSGLRLRGNRENYSRSNRKSMFDLNATRGDVCDSSCGCMAHAATLKFYRDG